MKPIKTSDYIALLSTSGIIAWMMTDCFGGMVLYLFSYWYLVLPFCLLYVISFFQTIVLVAWKGYAPNKVKVLAHVVLVAFIAGLNVYQSDLLKSKRIMAATLKDDLFHYTLVLREDGTVDNEVSGMFGFSEVFHGRYHTKGDTLIFTKVPYDTRNFIPDTLLIDKKAGAIFISRNKDRTFAREKGYLDYFRIHE